jgi:hypothetical protein
VGEEGDPLHPRADLTSGPAAGAVDGTGQRGSVGRKRATVRSGHRRWNLALRGGCHRTAVFRVAGPRTRLMRRSIEAPAPSMHPGGVAVPVERRAARRTWTNRGGKVEPGTVLEGLPPVKPEAWSPRPQQRPAQRRRPSSRAERFLDDDAR